MNARGPPRDRHRGFIRAVIRSTQRLHARIGRYQEEARAQATLVDQRSMAPGFDATSLSRRCETLKAATRGLESGEALLGTAD